MISLDFLTGYISLIIVGICLCVGYVVKKWIKDIDNKYIPTINAVIGLLLSVWMAGFTFTPDILLTGLFSGLASTGLYEAFRNFLEKGPTTFNQ